jgi:AraC family transcriptional regulator
MLLRRSDTRFFTIRPQVPLVCPCMTIPGSSMEYTKRMHRALEYIDRNLERPLALSEIASIAHFSEFHFHRVFAAWLGETFGEYLRRRRLEVSATSLVGQPQLTVLSVALSVGFGSSEAFSRAFKTRFRCTPTAWRRRENTARSMGRNATREDQGCIDSNPDQLDSKGSQTANDQRRQHDFSCQSTPEKVMKVAVIDRQPVKVAYLRHVGPYGESLSRFWQSVAYPWMVSNSLLGKPRYGVSHDDPTITAPEKCRYDAAVEVTGPLIAPGQALMTIIPGGRYGVTQFRGTAGQIGAVWDRLMRDWLPSSGLQLDARPFIECYSQDSTFDPKTGVVTCELAVPVAAL